MFQSLDQLKNNLALAKNEVYVELDQPVSIRHNDEIALIPPISGG